MKVFCGDLIHVHGKDKDDKDTIFYAEVVGITDETEENQELEVFYLEPTESKPYLWSYASDWDIVYTESVIQVFRPTKETYINVFKEFGFDPTVRENCFIKRDVLIPSNELVPIALDAVDMRKNAYEKDDFIVEDGPFTPAPATSEFVKETHQAVNKFNTWKPKTVSEGRVKTFIEGWSSKYEKMDDEHQFQKGSSVDYLHPLVE